MNKINIRECCYKKIIGSYSITCKKCKLKYCSTECLEKFIIKCNDCEDRLHICNFNQSKFIDGSLSSCKSCLLKSEIKRSILE